MSALVVSTPSLSVDSSATMTVSRLRKGRSGAQAPPKNPPARDRPLRDPGVPLLLGNDALGVVMEVGEVLGEVVCKGWGLEELASCGEGRAELGWCGVIRGEFVVVLGELV